MGIKSAITQFASELRSPDITKLELRSDPLNNPAIPLSTSGFLAWASGAEPTASGEQVTILTALQQATVNGCVRVISETVASLPVRVFELTDQGRKDAPDHDLTYLLGVAPNPEMTAFTFWESFSGSLALTGNAYAEIQRDKGGRAVAIWPLRPDLTEPKRLPPKPDGTPGDVIYETTDGMTDGRTRRIPAANILHCPLFSFDGMKGFSPIQLARQGIGLARAAEKSGARFFGNGARPGGILSTTSDLDDDAIKAVKDSWNRTQGGDKQGSTAVLPGDWKYTPTSTNNKDAQFIEARQFQRSEICAIFRVPPHMVGDTTKLSNANAENASREFITDCIRPYLSRLESEVTRKLLPTIGRNSGRFEVQFDVTERLRGDTESQAAGYAAGKQWGWLSTNDIRTELGWNPIGPVGDTYWVPVNMQNADRLLDTESVQDQPIGDQPLLGDGNSHDDATPTAAERSMLGRYTTAYISIYRDAFGRLLKRDKRDFETVAALFAPVLRSIADVAQDTAMSQNHLTMMPSAALDRHVETVCRSLAKRAETYTADDAESAVGTEFAKAVRSLVINIRRDAAAFAAEQEIGVSHEPSEA
jgi:HK97 family phage portal protein